MPDNVCSKADAPGSSVSPEALDLRLRALADLDSAHWQSHSREHELMAQSREAYHEALDRRLTSMNQLREQITQERGMFVERGAYDTRHEDVRRRIQSVENQIANFQGRFWVLATLPGIFVVIVNFLLYYLSRH